ncbi:MAG: hypothetical protein AAF826_12130 [Pseudomonadota bacterium]
MAKFELIEKPVLGNYVRSIADVTLTEVADLGILSIATPLGGEKKRDAALKKPKLAAVEPGKSSKAGSLRLVGMAADQHFLLSEGAALPEVKDVYTTDQSHNWVAIRAEGPAIWAAMERICMLDLHPEVCLIDDAPRFDIETMATLMVKEDENTILLLSASSSARSFLHAIETALVSVS